MGKPGGGKLKTEVPGFGRVMENTGNSEVRPHSDKGGEWLSIRMH